MFTSGTAWNRLNMSIGSYGLGCGNIFSDMNFGGFMDYDAMMGWNTVNSIFTMGACILGTIATSNRETKAAANAELKTAKNNEKSLTEQKTKLTENKKILEDGFVENNLVNLEKVLPTEVKAYNKANNYLKEFTVYDTTYHLDEEDKSLVDDYDTSIKSLEGKIAELKEKDDPKSKKTLENLNKTLESLEQKKNDLLKASFEKYAKAKSAKTTAEKTLKEKIASELETVKTKLKKVEADLTEAKEKLEELDSPSKQKSGDNAIDKQFDNDDGEPGDRATADDVRSRFEENGELKADYDSKNAEKDFKGALSQYRAARLDSNTEKMKLWGNRALQLYEKMNSDQQAEYYKSKKYMEQDRNAETGTWSKKAKPELGV